MADTCECSNEPARSMKCGELLDWLKAGYILKKDCAIEYGVSEIKNGSGLKG